MNGIQSLNMAQSQCRWVEEMEIKRRAWEMFRRQIFPPFDDQLSPDYEGHICDDSPISKLVDWEVGVTTYRKVRFRQKVICLVLDIWKLRCLGILKWSKWSSTRGDWYSQVLRNKISAGVAVLAVINLTDVGTQGWDHRRGNNTRKSKSNTILWDNRMQLADCTIETKSR